MKKRTRCNYCQREIAGAVRLPRGCRPLCARCSPDPYFRSRCDSQLFAFMHVAAIAAQHPGDAGARLALELAAVDVIGALAELGIKTWAPVAHKLEPPSDAVIDELVARAKRRLSRAAREAAREHPPASSRRRARR